MPYKGSSIIKTPKSMESSDGTLPPTSKQLPSGAAGSGKKSSK